MNEPVRPDVDEERVCKQCNQPFILSSGEKHYFIVAGLEVPKRCPSCREKNKLKKPEVDNATK